MSQRHKAPCIFITRKCRRVTLHTDLIRNFATVGRKGLGKIAAETETTFSHLHRSRESRDCSPSALTTLAVFAAECRTYMYARYGVVRITAEYGNESMGRESFVYVQGAKGTIEGKTMSAGVRETSPLIYAARWRFNASTVERFGKVSFHQRTSQQQQQPAHRLHHVPFA